MLWLSNVQYDLRNLIRNEMKMKKYKIKIADNLSEPNC